VGGYDALPQLPPQRRARILIRIDGAGATHELLGHLHALNTSHRGAVHRGLGWAGPSPPLTRAPSPPVPRCLAPSLDQDGQVDIDAWTRPLGLRGQPYLAHAEPDALHAKILHGR